MPIRELVERVVHWASQPPGDVRLAEARRAFEARTAPIEIDQPDYESRISHFLDGYVCSEAEGGAPAPVAAFAAQHANLSAEERLGLAGLLRSQRSLFRVEHVQPSVTLTDLLAGGRFDVHPSAAEVLAAGDIFDGRIAASAFGLALAPGRVFHPADTHAPLLQLLQDAAPRRYAPDVLLDALLGMRDRLHRFTRVRPEHLYRVEAIGSRGFSATWTQSTPPPPGPDSQ